MTHDQGARITQEQVREFAARVLPPRQLQAWRLHAGGCGYQRIGEILGISKTGARYLVDAARRNLLAALETEVTRSPGSDATPTAQPSTPNTPPSSAKP